MTPAEAIVAYSDYANDVANSSYENFQNNLRRFMSLFDPEQPLGQIVSQLLPPVAFDEWYTKCEATGGSMVGSSTLDWPLPRREKVALQLELLRRIATGAIDIYGFCSQFCDAGAYPDANISKFVSQIFRPFQRDFLRTLEAATPRPEPAKPAISDVPNIIDEGRLDELRRSPRGPFDFARLVRLCEELNTAYRQHCYHAVALLTRTILDHVPPVFNVRSFTEVVSNYRGGKSFKEAMENLENSARKIADAHLHTQIRKSEVLPNAMQVNFSNNLDVLLAEIVRLQKFGVENSV